MLLGGVAFASAQTAEPKKHDDAMHSESGKAGKEEPSSRDASAPPANAPLWNGAPAVPGAKAEGETVPAKFSAKNDADDKLSIWGYTFKHLSDAQRRAIYQAVKKEGPAAPDATATLGVHVPEDGGAQTAAERSDRANSGDQYLQLRNHPDQGSSGQPVEPGCGGGARAIDRASIFLRKRWVAGSSPATTTAIPGIPAPHYANTQDTSAEDLN